MARNPCVVQRPIEKGIACSKAIWQRSDLDDPLQKVIQITYAINQSLMVDSTTLDETPNFLDHVSPVYYLKGFFSFLHGSLGEKGHRRAEGDIPGE